MASLILGVNIDTTSEASFSISSAAVEASARLVY